MTASSAKSNLPTIALNVGFLLIVQGVAFYFGTETSSITALIPAGVGVLLALLGLLAYRESARKHAAHAAALVAALGLLAAIGRMASAGLSWSAPSASLIFMIILCGGFLALCVKSFLEARRR